MLKKIIVVFAFLAGSLGILALLGSGQAFAQSVCLNECSFYGQHESQDTSGRTCGNYDSDACLEWSSWKACDIQSFFCGDKTCNSQCGETFSNCSKDCSSPNPLPVVDAGPNKEIFEGANVVLEGSVTDPEAEPLTMRWDCPGGRFSDPNIAKPVFYAPSEIAGSAKDFSCTLRAQDYRGAISSDVVLVTVKKRAVTLLVEKLARNISQKQAAWQNIVSAVPYDRIEFKIELTATSDTANIFLKDLLPQGLSYQGNLKIDGKASNQNITSTLKIGDLAAGQTKVVTFQAQVLPENSFNIGTTGLTNLVQVRANFMPEISDSASLNVIKGPAKFAVAGQEEAPYAEVSDDATGTQALVKGATLVGTGVTNRVIESLLPPLFVALMLVLAFKSKIVWLDQWLDRKKVKIRNYQTEASLKRKITEIKAKEPEIYETWARKD